MELSGHRPLMVAGHGDNIKITNPGDLMLAVYYLQQQGQA
jgi:2-C-methyl-D-erythritol 4-phosphate cytidylyltransferase